MNTLTKIRGEEIEKHLKRILGNVEAVVATKPDGDTHSLFLSTDKGRVQVTAGAFPGEFNVAVTLPKHCWRVIYSLKGKTATADFDKEEDAREYAAQEAFDSEPEVKELEEG